MAAVERRRVRRPDNAESRVADDAFGWAPAEHAPEYGGSRVPDIDGDLGGDLDARVDQTRRC
jgi:hypothetical protein